MDYQKLKNYLKILLHLKQFEGDGQLQIIEDVIDADKKLKSEIFGELVREEFIKLEGGHDNSAAFIGYPEGSKIRYSRPKSEDVVYSPFKGKLTFKGSKYLKEELAMIENNKYTFTVGDNSTANFIVNSPYSTINNKTEIIEKAKTIIGKIKSDNSIDKTAKENAINSINQLITEVENNSTSKETIKEILTTGAKIASIGSLVASLVQLIISGS